MAAPGKRSRNPATVLETLLLGLVAGLVLVDVALLAGAPTPVPADSIRLLLAVGSFGVPVLGVALGVVHARGYAVGAVVSIPLVVLYAYTSLLLPWTQLSYYVGQVGLELLLGVPVVGEPLALALFGGFTLSEATLRAAFRYHYALVGLGIVAAVAIATTLFRRRPARTERSPGG